MSGLRGLMMQIARFSREPFWPRCVKSYLPCLSRISELLIWPVIVLHGLWSTMVFSMRMQAKGARIQVRDCPLGLNFDSVNLLQGLTDDQYDCNTQSNTNKSPTVTLLFIKGMVDKNQERYNLTYLYQWIIGGLYASHGWCGWSGYHWNGKFKYLMESVTNQSKPKFLLESELRK